MASGSSSFLFSSAKAASTWASPWVYGDPRVDRGRGSCMDHLGICLRFPWVSMGFPHYSHGPMIHKLPMNYPHYCWLCPHDWLLVDSYIKKWIMPGIVNAQSWAMAVVNQYDYWMTINHHMIFIDMYHWFPIVLLIIHYQYIYQSLLICYGPLAIIIIDNNCNYILSIGFHWSL